MIATVHPRTNLFFPAFCLPGYMVPASNYGMEVLEVTRTQISECRHRTVTRERL